MKIKTRTAVAVVAAAIAVVLLAGGCNKGKLAGELQGIPAPGTAFQAGLRVEPYPPRYNQDVTFHVVLRDETGKPIEGASVTADIVMPEMDMGPNKVALRDLGHGEYEGVGRFGMGGKHAVVVNAFKAGAAAKVVFNLNVEL